ncbi:MAG: GMC family oxidoreductase N-terminal domain-containing protein [Betaproteobacteria bacterium]|nr:GMC family oxidoreductase N-terminal domain-containing protein [Betaproteobacteria bacterium]
MITTRGRERALKGGRGRTYCPIFGNWSRRIPESSWPAFSRAVAESLQARGLVFSPDMNAAHGDGVFPFPHNNTPQSRVTMAMAYLNAEVRARPNLRIIGRRTASRILIDAGRAVGVRTQVDGSTQDFFTGEVVLSCGALQTPVLLPVKIGVALQFP